MKMSIANKKYNVQDNTMIELNLRGMNVGMYRQGDFDNWELNYIEKIMILFQILKIIFVEYYIENIMYL